MRVQEEKEKHKLQAKEGSGEEDAGNAKGGKKHEKHGQDREGNGDCLESGVHLRSTVFYAVQKLRGIVPIGKKLPKSLQLRAEKLMAHQFGNCLLTVSDLCRIGRGWRKRCGKAVTSCLCARAADVLVDGSVAKNIKIDILWAVCFQIFLSVQGKVLPCSVAAGEVGGKNTKMAVKQEKIVLDAVMRPYQENEEQEQRRGNDEEHGISVISSGKGKYHADKAGTSQEHNVLRLFLHMYFKGEAVFS